MKKSFIVCKLSSVWILKLKIPHIYSKISYKKKSFLLTPERQQSRLYFVSGTNFRERETSELFVHWKSTPLVPHKIYVIGMHITYIYVRKNIHGSELLGKACKAHNDFATNARDNKYEIIILS